MLLNVNERALMHKCEDYADWARLHYRTDWEALEKTMGQEYAEQKCNNTHEFMLRAYDRVDTVAMMLSMHTIDAINWWRGCKKLSTWSEKRRLLEYYIERGHGYWQK